MSQPNQQPQMAMPIGVRLPEHRRRELEVIAQEERRSLANIVRVMVEDALDARKQQAAA